MGQNGALDLPWWLPLHACLLATSLFVLLPPPRLVVPVSARCLSKVDLVTKFSPLDTQSFITEQPHRSFHHYLKVVAGHYKLTRKQPKVAYHILATNQVGTRSRARNLLTQ